MEGFATGFSVNSSTQPGFSVENEKYRIELKGVTCDDTKNIVSHGFEYCYDWREVMELVLTATVAAGNDNTADIEEAAEDAMKLWMTTFHGWGLLSSIVPDGALRHVIFSLAYTSFNWDVETGGDYTEEKVFNAVKLVYDNIEGKELKCLLPKFGIWFEEIVDRGEEDERKKNFTIFFNSKWMLEIKFVVEKKRLNRNLLELAAETVVRVIERDEEIEFLAIPPSLFGVVREKFRDAEWVRNYWRLLAEIHEEEEDSEYGFSGKLDVWPGSDVAGEFECNREIINERVDPPDTDTSEQDSHDTIVKKVIDPSDSPEQDVDSSLHLQSVWMFLCLAVLVGGLLACYIGHHI